MRKVLFSALVVTAVLLFALQPAFAITNGQPDGDGHPFVGALSVEFASGKDWVCSGTLIAPQLFLTAAHCVNWLPEGTPVFVSFEPLFSAGNTFYPGHYVMAPITKNGLAHDYDLALVFLDDPVAGSEMASLPVLPELGYFDQLGARGLRDQLFTSVGYGSPGRIKDGGPLEFFYDGLRRFAVGSFNALDKNWLHLSMNPATGDGGTCYGDSGGPNFVGAGENKTPIIAGVTVTGDMVCQATNVIIRLDTPAAHQFIDPYLP
jgi:Trypsin